MKRETELFNQVERFCCFIPVTTTAKEESLRHTFRDYSVRLQ
ncbi:hypothetical protein RE628_07755 [Paenibacillus sp. D2_2]|nr:hypothetical protein [Paenibacillus sp. D2_2]WMT42286.1 hypothetical protein RE628_07755 [Paenibacillus sp. D2_2]